MKKNILVTGANGQLGSECRVLSETLSEYDFVFLTKEDLSIDNLEDVNKYFSQHKIDVCINCAAYTAVDLAETEMEQAYNINALAVGNLAHCCKKYQVRFIHVSTDYVFDGENNVGYLDTDLPAPLNIYGKSKLEGERLAMSENPASIIIRTSWVYSSFGKNFVKTMMKLMQERQELNIVSDQIGRPTYARDLAKAIFSIISDGKNDAAGIYHYANQGVLSWYEFAMEIKKIGNYTCTLHPIPSSAYPVPAKRPSFSILNTEKIEQHFNITIPSWKESLTHCMSLLS